MANGRPLSLHRVERLVHVNIGPAVWYVVMTKNKYGTKPRIPGNDGIVPVQLVPIPNERGSQQKRKCLRTGRDGENDFVIPARPE